MRGEFHEFADLRLGPEAVRRQGSERQRFARGKIKRFGELSVQVEQLQMKRAGVDVEGLGLLLVIMDAASHPVGEGHQDFPAIERRVDDVLLVTPELLHNRRRGAEWRLHDADFTLRPPKDQKTAVIDPQSRRRISGRLTLRRTDNLPAKLTIIRIFVLTAAK